MGKFNVIHSVVLDLNLPIWAKIPTLELATLTKSDNPNLESPESYITPTITSKLVSRRLQDARGLADNMLSTYTPPPKEPLAQYHIYVFFDLYVTSSVHNEFKQRLVDDGLKDRPGPQHKRSK